MILYTRKQFNKVVNEKNKLMEELEEIETLFLAANKRVETLKQINKEISDLNVQLLNESLLLSDDITDKEVKLESCIKEIKQLKSLLTRNKIEYRKEEK